MDLFKSNFFINRSGGSLFSALSIYLLYFYNESIFSGFLVNHARIQLYAQLLTFGLPPVVQTLVIQNGSSVNSVTHVIWILFISSFTISVSFFFIFDFAFLYLYIPFFSLHYNLLALKLGQRRDKDYFFLLWIFGIAIVFGVFLSVYSINFIYLPFALSTFLYLVFYTDKLYFNKIDFHVLLNYKNLPDFLGFYSSNVGYKNISYVLTYILKPNDFVIFRVIFSAGTFLWNLIFNLLFEKFLSIQQGSSKISEFRKLNGFIVLFIFMIIIFYISMFLFNDHLNIYLISLCITLCSVIINFSNSISYSLLKSAKRVISDLFVFGGFCCLYFFGILSLLNLTIATSVITIVFLLFIKHDFSSNEII